MSTNGSFADLYQRYAPRWFKVIRWRDMAKRNIAKQKYLLVCVYAPFAYYVVGFHDPYHIMLILKRPGTEEERMALKRDHSIREPMARDWPIDYYTRGRPPMYDVWKRRQAYPEYYKDKYDGTRGDESIM